MKKYHGTHLALISLGAIAATLPIFSGYFVSFLLLVWLGWSRFGRSVPLAEQSNEISAICASVFRPLLLGTVAMFVLLVLANLVSNGLNESPAPWPRVLSKLSHFGIKYMVLAWVIFASWLVLVKRQLRPDHVVPVLIVWFIIHTLYLVAQRQWGINWSHGFDAVLGPHRFAYDVFRISGFMGHPLTLTYVLCLWLFASSGLAQAARSYGGRQSAIQWTAIAALCAFSLLISGSRFALVVVILVLMIVYGRNLMRHVKILAPLLVGVMLILWWEGSMAGRVLEIFDTNQELGQRFSRVYFWQAHLAMFLDHPWAGVGLVHLQEALPEYYHQIGYHDKIYSAHNIYLQFLADSGLIGFLGLCSFLVGFGFAARRMQVATGSSALWSLWLVTVIAGTMQNVLRDSEFLYALWVLSALVVVQAAHGFQTTKQPTTS